MEATLRLCPVLAALSVYTLAMATAERLGSGSGPGRHLDEAELKRFAKGREVFSRSYATKEGLGPSFNAQSCAACHEDPVVGGAGGLRRNVFQGAERSRYPGLSAQEGRNIPQRAIVSSRRTLKDMDEERDTEVRSFMLMGTVQTPSILGMGLVDTIDEQEILSREDPEDVDSDGIRGVASRIQVRNRTEIGRFGWRAELPSMRDFVRAACGGELGLTVPDDDTGFGFTEDVDVVMDPEMSAGDVESLAFFCAELAPPVRGGRADEPEVRRGAQLFAAVGCAACHVPSLNGAKGPVELYSDLLLHEVVKDPVMSACRSGDERNRGQGITGALGEELVATRTAPLWGISKTAPYLHDGRARTVEQAIAAHEGEAESVRQAFEASSAADRRALSAFLEDL